MNYLLIISILLVSGMVIFLIKRNNKHKTKLEDIGESVEDVTESFNETTDIVLSEMSSEEFVSTQLKEIKNPSLLIQLSSLIPIFVSESANLLNKPKLSESGLYEIIIPNGAIIQGSKDITQTVRGFYKDSTGAVGNVNLRRVELGSRLGSTMTGMSTMMNLSSILIGQYYMSEINSRLEIIQDEIKQISNFQQHEFRSRVITSMDHVLELSRYSEEILVNDEVRLDKLLTVAILKLELTQLIEQLIVEMREGLVILNQKEFTEYEVKSNYLDRQILLVVNLLNSLHELSNIEFILGKGTRSKEMVFSMHTMEKIKVIGLFDEIKDWQDEHISIYEIDLINQVREKRGIRKTLGSMQSVYDKEKLYDHLNHYFIEIVNKQLKLSLQEPVNLEDLDNIKIIYDEEQEKYYVSFEEREL